ncbi:MAG: hypothetical protein GXO83_02880 [Chlorobi bacterium]|nr:hypothetical protein [Chlorobiota bacterium]
MINIGVVGQTDASTGLVTHLHRSKRFQCKKIIFPLSGSDSLIKSGENDISRYLGGDYDRILFTELQQDQMELVRIAIKKGIPVFFLSTSNLPLPLLDEITKLSSEAGTPAICYNGYWYDPVFTQIRSAIQDPFLCHFYIRKDIERIQDSFALLHDQIEISLLLTRGHFMRSVVNSYTLTNHKTDFIFVQLEYDSGARTEIMIQGTGRPEGYFIIRQPRNIITWYSAKSLVVYESPTPEGIWKQHKKRYRKRSVADPYMHWIRAIEETGSGKSIAPTIEDRLHTAQLFSGIREKLTSRIT